MLPTHVIMLQVNMSKSHVYIILLYAREEDSNSW